MNQSKTPRNAKFSFEDLLKNQIKQEFGAIVSSPRYKKIPEIKKLMKITPRGETTSNWQDPIITARDYKEFLSSSKEMVKAP
jgi:hypothetical protein